MKKIPAQIHFADHVLIEVDECAKRHGISRNAFVNMACSHWLREDKSRVTQLQEENFSLREKVIKVALAKGGIDYDG